MNAVLTRRLLVLSAMTRDNPAEDGSRQEVAGIRHASGMSVSPKVTVNSLSGFDKVWDGALPLSARAA